MQYFADGVFIPNTKLMRFWDNMMRTLAVYNFIVVPIQIASTEVQNSSTITILDWVRHCVSLPMNATFSLGLIFNPELINLMAAPNSS